MATSPQVIMCISAVGRLHYGTVSGTQFEMRWLRVAYVWVEANYLCVAGCREIGFA